MLYTRCPECETTFRITESALQQAQGQVRCGRCGNIFNAHESLTDRLPDPDDPAPAAPLADTVPKGNALPDRPDATPAANVGTVGIDTPPAETPPTPPAGNAVEGAAALDRDTDGAMSLAAELEAAAAEAEAELDAETEGGGENGTGLGAPVMSANEVDAVLDRAASAEPPHWLDESAAPAPALHRRQLQAAAAVATLLLAVQVAHHFRSTLAGMPVVGGVVTGLYDLFGQRVDPNWDVNGYELVDWMAIEAPGESAAQRNLVIRSQLRNATDKAQPYPLMHLQLLDRWEDAVGARLFEPAEYASGIDADAGALMAAGATVDTELVIVDPGTDAYGFELAVCLETATGIVCDTDATFR